MVNNIHLENENFKATVNDLRPKLYYLNNVINSENFINFISNCFDIDSKQITYSAFGIFDANSSPIFKGKAVLGLIETEGKGYYAFACDDFNAYYIKGDVRPDYLRNIDNKYILNLLPKAKFKNEKFQRI